MMTQVEAHSIGPMEISPTPDGTLILDTRVNNSVHVKETYSQHVPPVAHRLLYNNFLSQMERLYLDGFKNISMEVGYFSAETSD